MTIVSDNTGDREALTRAVARIHEAAQAMRRDDFTAAVAVNLDLDALRALDDFLQERA